MIQDPLTASLPSFDRQDDICHPLVLFKEEWAVHGEITLHSGGLIVRHDIEPPDEVETPGVTHNMLMMVLNKASRQVHRFSGSQYDGPQQPGNFGLLPAGESAFFHWESTDEVICFMTEPQFLQKTAIENDCLNSDELELQPILMAMDPQIHALALQFKQEMQNNALGGQMYSESLANVFAIHLLRNYCTTAPILRTYAGGLSTKRLKQTIAYIQAHLHEKLSLDAIAAELNLSIYYFCELFTQSMGIPPYKYVLQQRVERAKQLLKQSQKPLAEIALDCGFASQSHLNRHFHKLAGVTPKKYRDR
ncbi:MAG: helix-turn-helix transcriptional regulator [Acaryochloridaceae cyanobacterium RU_4_10]|nr:helix-turn-helix transcriptional regulator [Acaryochloridaceae cyanobacterium RU_4_10]